MPTPQREHINLFTFSIIRVGKERYGSSYRFHSTHEVEPRGIRIIVYTRFDSDTVDPESLALTFGKSAAVNANIAAPSVEIEFYNDIGDGAIGCHYEAMSMLCTVHSKASKSICMNPFNARMSDFGRKC